MSWTAVMPLRQGPEPKSRLASRFSAAQRIGLSQQMARSVLAALHACPLVERIILLSPVAPPAGMAGQWQRDEGRGLNSELGALRHSLHHPAMLVVHADLPLLTADDVAALAGGAIKQGYALAPDRHGIGTNGIAARKGQRFAFSFDDGGLARDERGSFGRHLIATPDAAVIHRPGLALDIDTPADLDEAMMRGFVAFGDVRVGE